MPEYKGEFTILNASRLDQAVGAWNRVSKHKIKDAAEFQSMLSLSPKLRSWYSDWSFQFAAFKTMPKSFADAGITPGQWTAIVSRLPEVNKVRSQISMEIESKAKEFADFVKMKEAEANSKLAKLEVPEIKILKVNVLCLPFEDQLKILNAPEDDRAFVEEQLLEKLRAKLLADLKAGNYKDPFIYGDYKDLML